ncbi:hypothetical protein RyT2_23760 [Pseudolactococcus yaeyamensis]
MAEMYYKISYKLTDTRGEFFMMSGKSYSHVYERAYESALAGLRRRGTKMVYGTFEMEEISEEEYFIHRPFWRY